MCFPAGIRENQAGSVGQAGLKRDVVVPVAVGPDGPSSGDSRGETNCSSTLVGGVSVPVKVPALINSPGEKRFPGLQKFPKSPDSTIGVDVGLEAQTGGNVAVGVWVEVEVSVGVVEGVHVAGNGRVPVGGEVGGGRGWFFGGSGAVFGSDNLGGITPTIKTGQPDSLYFHGAILSWNPFHAPNPRDLPPKH